MPICRRPIFKLVTLRPLSTIYLALAVIGSLLPQLAQAQPLPERRPLHGRVITPENEPVKGATVTIRQQTDIAMATFWGSRVATDANGEFYFPDAEDGSYYISVTSTGFAPLQNKSYILDETTTQLNITLDRLATLPLHVVKPDGSVLTGTSVMVRLQAAQAQPMPLARATTDTNGDTSLPGLLPGVYTVQVLAEGTGVVTLRNVDVRYLAQPKPLEIRLQAGGTLRVVVKEPQKDKEPRAVGGAVITFTTAAPDSDAAKATGGGGYPDDMAIYAMQAMQSGSMALVTRDGEGALQIADVTPGTYNVKVFSPSHKPATAQAVEVKAGQTATAEFSVEAATNPAALDVLVHDTADKPIANTEFSLQIRPLGSNNAFNGGAPPPAPDVPAPIRTLFGSGTYVRRGRTDKDGKLTLYPVQPGKLRVTLLPAGVPDGTVPGVMKEVTLAPEGGSVTIQIALPATK